MENLILDTNALIYAIKNKIDIKIEITKLVQTFKILIPECVIYELNGLSKSNFYAKAALKYANNFNIIKSEGKGDECVHLMAKKLNAYVMTNDRGLIKILKNDEIKVIIIDNKKSFHFY